MIIELTDKTLKFHAMLVPELVDKTFIQYIYEPNTEHLIPKLTIEGLEFYGDRKFIAMTHVFGKSILKVKVDLLNDRGDVIRSYENPAVPYYSYHVLAKKPVRPDVEDYIRKLEFDIEQLKIAHKLEVDQLNKEITRLRELGEVV